MVEQRSISQVKPDALALRALAHPQRLRIDGPATATGLATRLGLNSGATSYHLRQLARHGFIEEDETRGTARDRWWRARHESTNVPSDTSDEDALDASIAFSQAALNWQIGQMQLALARHAELAPEWRRASALSDFIVPMTAEDASALIEKLHAVLWEAMAKAPAPGGPYPEGVLPMTFILHAFQRPPDDGAGS